uniref:Uncharacterized protein n=1 Tax=Romanomermis culicivorax TaxID=13658 RepID=A0A915KAX6_ROMCU
MLQRDFAKHIEEIQNHFIGDYACRTLIKRGMNPQSPLLVLQQLPFVDCILACKRHPECLSDDAIFLPLTFDLPAPLGVSGFNLPLT